MVVPDACQMLLKNQRSDKNDNLNDKYVSTLSECNKLRFIVQLKYYTSLF